MTWSDVDLKNKTYLLRTKRSGNGLEKVTKHNMSNSINGLFLKRYEMRHPELEYVLWHNYYSSKAGCRVDDRFQTIGKMTQYLCKKAGIPVFGLHQLRHLATAILKTYGQLSIAELQFFLRHDNQKLQKFKQIILIVALRCKLVYLMTFGVSSWKVLLL